MVETIYSVELGRQPVSYPERHHPHQTCGSPMNPPRPSSPKRSCGRGPELGLWEGPMSMPDSPCNQCARRHSKVACEAASWPRRMMQPSRIQLSSQARAALSVGKAEIKKGETSTCASHGCPTLRFPDTSNGRTCHNIIVKLYSITS